MSSCGQHCWQLFSYGLPKLLTGRSNVRIKRMGDLDQKHFFEICKQRFPFEEAQVQAATLCILWQENLKNPKWHQFKVVTSNGITVVEWGWLYYKSSGYNKVSYFLESHLEELPLVAGNYQGRWDSKTSQVGRGREMFGTVSQVGMGRRDVWDCCHCLEINEILKPEWKICYSWTLEFWRRKKGHALRSYCFFFFMNMNKLKRKRAQ